MSIKVFQNEADVKSAPQGTFWMVKYKGKRTIIIKVYDSLYVRISDGGIHGGVEVGYDTKWFGVGWIPSCSRVTTSSA